MISTLFALAILQRSAFHISVIDGRPWLTHGKERFLLPRETGNWEWSYDQGSLTGWQVAGGMTIKRVTRGPQEWELLDLATFKNGKELARLDFETLGRQWLATDDLWGGHQKANDLRYLAGRSWISEFLPCPGPNPKWGLAVLAVQNMSASLRPILNQALIRIDFAPLKATFIAEIGYLHQPDLIVTPAYHRLVPKFKLIDVTLKGGFTYYDPAKKFGSSVFPEFGSEELPLGSLSTGEIVVLNVKDRKARLFTTSKIMDARFNLQNPDIQLAEGIPSVDSSLFRLGTFVFSRKNPKGTDYKKPVLLWKDWVIDWDGKTATIHDRATGRVLARASKSKK